MNELSVNNLAMKDLATQFQPIVAAQPYPLVFLSVSGSHLYGFSSPDSDYDLRGMHLTPVKEVLGLFGVHESVHSTSILDGIEVDFATHESTKYLELLLKKSGNILEQIYSPLVIVTSPEHEALKSIALTCVTRHFVHHYFGMAKTQWIDFEKENPHRVKPLLYVYRSLLTGYHLMRTGEIEPNLTHLNTLYPLAYIPELITRKQMGTEHGVLDTVDFAFHEGEYTRLKAELETAYQNSSLPENPTGKEALNDWLMGIRLAQLHITE